jgi:spore coat polysaccharide biosynthesis protein SpsF
MPALGFLQARMGSSRLPGKVLLRINGQTILERCIRRLKATDTLDGVVVVTTERDEDDEVVVAAVNLGVPVFRGEELDVLRRFHGAAQKFHPDIIVRATADNPLLDIGSVDRVVRAVKSSDLDYCMEIGLPVGGATEALTTRTLARVHDLAERPDHREHVTLYIKDHPERFRLAFLEPPDILRRPDVRITVDTPEDFVFLENLLGTVPEADYPVPLERYLEQAEAVARGRV